MLNTLPTFKVHQGTLSAARPGPLTGETQFSSESLDVFVRGDDFRVVSKDPQQELRTRLQEQALCVQAGEGPSLTELRFPLQFLSSGDRQECGKARWLSGHATPEHCQVGLHRMGEVSIFTVTPESGFNWHSPVD